MTITQSSFHIEIEEILSELNHNVQQMFIKKYVSIPPLPLARIQLLNLLLNQALLPSSLRKIYCTTTGLVQMGLDVHEEIVNQRQFGEKEIRSRQLSILAGDYYSSKYYSILSKANLIDGIKILASGIRDVNIAKMKLYTENNGQGFHSVDELIDAVKQKEIALYIPFLDLLPYKEQEYFWERLLGNMILLLTLTEELKQHQISRHHFSYILLNYFVNMVEKREIEDNNLDWKVKTKKLLIKYDIHGKVQDIIQRIQTDLIRTIDQIDNKMLKTELNHILKQVQDSIYSLDNVAKEI